MLSSVGVAAKAEISIKHTEIEMNWNWRRLNWIAQNNKLIKICVLTIKKNITMLSSVGEAAKAEISIKHTEIEMNWNWRRLNWIAQNNKLIKICVLTIKKNITMLSSVGEAAKAEISIKHTEIELNWRRLNWIAQNNKLIKICVLTIKKQITMLSSVGVAAKAEISIKHTEIEMNWNWRRLNWIAQNNKLIKMCVLTIKKNITMLSSVGEAAKLDISIKRVDN